jgi:aldose 1-epimerase
MILRAALLATVATFSATLGGAAHAAEARREAFGTLPDGRAVEAVVLSNGHGVSARVLAWGGILQSLTAPDRAGRTADVVAGYVDLAHYLAKPNYFGAAVGRYANRIGGARFALDGKTYQLAANNGPNSLHGGNEGFDKRLWTIEEVRSGPAARVVLSYTSPDGEEGFPGTLKVSLTYALDEKGTLSMEFRATTDKATVVNLTGHSYFNLSGEGSGSIEHHVLTIPADSFTPADDALIPTGELRPVTGTPFDFRKPAAIGTRLRDGTDEQIRGGRGYDHNWVIARAPQAAVRLHARVVDPASGRSLEVWSNQPGLQAYTGNFLDGTIVGKSGRVYRQGDTLCLEPQLFPDTPNKPQFGSARLDPGQTYVHRIEYRLGVVK